jgi:hypothetical protein
VKPRTVDVPVMKDRLWHCFKNIILFMPRTEPTQFYLSSLVIYIDITENDILDIKTFGLPFLCLFVNCLHLNTREIIDLLIAMSKIYSYFLQKNIKYIQCPSSLLRYRFSCTKSSPTNPIAGRMVEIAQCSQAEHLAIALAVCR